MKKIIFILFFFYINGVSLFAQEKLIQEIQNILNKLQTQAKEDLRGYIVKDKKLEIKSPIIQDYFARDTIIENQAEMLNITLSNVYNDSMRNRILSLLNNEYSEIELDTLVERRFKFEDKWCKKGAFSSCQFDTLSIYKERLKTYYARLKEEKKNKGESVGYDYFYKYDVFELLGFDTTACYKKAYDSLCIEERKELREMYRNQEYRKLDLIRVAGYIKDARFTNALEYFYKNGNSDEKEEAYDALMRLRVEPYYTEYLKEYTHTLEDVKTGQYFKKECMLFVVPYVLYNTIRSQESYLELSKYLFAKERKETCITSDDVENYTLIYGECLYEYVFVAILKNLQNEDIQEKWGKYKDTDLRKELSEKELIKLCKNMYDWMQKNYGKYKIRLNGWRMYP